MNNDRLSEFDNSNNGHDDGGRFERVIMWMISKLPKPAELPGSVSGQPCSTWGDPTTPEGSERLKRIIEPERLEAWRNGLLLGDMSAVACPNDFEPPTPDASA